MKVLIVERDSSLLETIRDICKDEGHEPVVATHCDDAYSLIQKGMVPDIIFCDQFVPHDSGIKLRDKLQRSVDLKDIPFILMRGQRNDASSDQELIKPFSMEEFLSFLGSIRLSSRTRT